MFSNMFWIRGERNVYINIRGEGSVIQVSLRGESVIYSKYKYFSKFYGTPNNFGCIDTPSS